MYVDSSPNSAKIYKKKINLPLAFRLNTSGPLKTARQVLRIQSKQKRDKITNLG